MKAKDLKLYNRRARALDLKLEGKSEREIAKILKVGATTAHNDIKIAIEDINTKDTKAINNKRTMIGIRLERIIDRLTPIAMGMPYLRESFTFDPSIYDSIFEFVDEDTGARYTQEEHDNLYTHNGYLTYCNCAEEVVGTRTEKELKKIEQEKKRKHLKEHTVHRPPDLKSLKLLLETFKSYSNLWGLSEPTPNVMIDSRSQTINLEEGKQVKQFIKEQIEGADNDLG